MQILPQSIVRLRQCRWRIVSVRRYEDCAVVTLRGIAPPCIGVERRVLTPFDRLEPLVRRTRPRVVRARLWRRACRAAIAADTPPGALRTAAGAAIDLHAHQLAPALAVLRGDGTRVLLADEVGLGKTIQAGLIARELLARGAVERVLVVTPAGLRDQWQAELRDRFGVASTVVDAREIRRAAAALPADVSPWSAFDVALTSIDYVKRADVLAATAPRPWDLVIVDEAHGVASDSDRSAAVDALSARASYVLLLTATPHSGDAEAFASLCRLGQVAGERLLVFRRTRLDTGLGTRRRVRTLHVRPTASERRLHTALRRYSDAVIASRPDAWLALSVLHKRALSSAAALADSVDRRLAVLDAESPPLADTQLDLPLDAPGEQTADDEAPGWAEALSLADTSRERRLLAALARAARAASRRESKIAALGRLLRRVRESVLVFTEYRDTLHHLQQAIHRPAIALHGAMTRDERRAAVDAFTSAPGAVMLATDAAGEGLNLQAACRLVVNLELPWNPMRLEQRLGRVDRIGQRHTVHAIHLIARGTGETALLARLHARLARARTAIGAPNPLAADEERAAAELVVLRRTPRESAAAEPLAGMALVDLAEDARSEMARLVERRQARLAGAHTASAGEEPLQPWVLRPRAALRRALRGRTLQIWRMAAEDGVGRIAETHVMALLLDRDRVEAAAAVAAAAASWRASAERLAHVFATTRLARNVAILESERRSKPASDQPMLFSQRRLAREALATASEREARQDAVSARIADARAAATLVFLPPELLLVVRPQ